MQMDEDAQLVLKVIDEFDGVLPFNDKARPETIQREFQMAGCRPPGRSRLDRSHPHNAVPAQNIRGTAYDR